MQSKQNLIDDVRVAKHWVDAQSTDMNDHLFRLQLVERDYHSRVGLYASVPAERPNWAESGIAAAEMEQSKALPDETRPSF